MTVTAINRKNQFTTNGVTTEFVFDFAITDIQQVKALTVVNDVETEYLNFTVVESISTEGGTLTTGSVLNGVDLLVFRDTDLTQQVDYAPGGRFPADSHEQALDKLTLQSQDQKEEIDRSLKSQISVEQAIELGHLADGKILEVDDGVISSSQASIGNISQQGLLEVINSEIVSTGISAGSIVDATAAANDAADNANNAAVQANDAIAGAGGIDIGDYEDDPLVSLYNEYVVFERGTNPTQWQVKTDVPTPYQIDTATYPAPSSDPNLSLIPSATQNINEISWHGRTVLNDVIIPSNKNAFSIGPTLTLADNVIVSVGSNANWRIL